MGDVPVGVFLSGGLDSSAIVSVMRNQVTGPFHTFSMGFEHEAYKESEYGKRFAREINTCHHHHTLRDKDAGTLMRKAVDFYDLLFYDNALIPTDALSREASRYVKVALSGDGADELFAGYITAQADRCYRFLEPLPRRLRHIFYRLADAALPRPNTKLSWNYKLRKFYYGTQYDYRKAHYAWRLIFTPEERVKILGAEQRELVYDLDPFHQFERYYRDVEHLDRVDQHLYVDTRTWLTYDILVKVDRCSMRHGLEVRCPYLDNDDVDFVARIPATYKIRGRRQKYLMKRALRPLLPDYILQRKKFGFNAPVGSWLNETEQDEFQAFTRFVYERHMKHT